MQKKIVLTAVALVAVTAAAFGTAALAERHKGMGEGGGMMQMLDFGAIDADKDGKITKDEIAAFRAARAAAIDANGDGKLGAEELAAMQMQGMQDRANQRAARMIERMDTDGDGLLTAAEMAAGHDGMPMFERIDADGDGAITQDEVDNARAQIGKRMQRHGMGGSMGQGQGQGMDMGMGMGMDDN